MTKEQPKKPVDMETVTEIAKILAPELDKAINNKTAPLLAEIASLKDVIKNEIKAMQQTAPAPAIAPAGTIKIGEQTIDLSNIAGEIQKLGINIDPNQLAQLQAKLGYGQAQTAQSAPTPAAGGGLTLPNGQQVNLAGLQQLMQILQMFGVMPNQQQQSGTPAYLMEAMQREMLDDLHFGSSIKRAVALSLTRKVGDTAALENYIGFNDTMVQKPLADARKAIEQQGAQTQNASKQG